MNAVSQGERIASLETQVNNLSGDVQELSAKIDSLLELKNKGMGAFWLASVLVGAVFTGLVTVVSDWFK